MRIAIIADVFPPLRSSGAVQLLDLSMEFACQGHEPTVLISAPELEADWHIETWNGVRIVRLKSMKTKDVGYVRRTIGEFLMPFAMLRNLRKSPLGNDSWDGVVWYSPTIFLGPIANALKTSSSCRSYLIIRDIFPEWAVDLGLMGKGIPYLFFKTIEKYQYSVADVIGVQTPANLAYFTNEYRHSGMRMEVLQNWLAAAQDAGCSICVKSTSLADRKICVYAGNMGVAQGMSVLLDLAENLQNRTDIGFLFVGRGSDVERLRADALIRGLDNVLFFDEIAPSEIPGLYAQCHIGLVALDPRHKTHNVPGKFLSYLQCGLPVLARVNPGNDLIHLITKERVGRVCTVSSADVLIQLFLDLFEEIAVDGEIENRCKVLATKLFSPATAVKQIIQALQG